MGILDAFTKTKRHNIDGREIIIIDKSKANSDIKKIIREAIIKVCTEEKVAKYFPKIQFILEEKQEQGIKVGAYEKSAGGWVNPTDLKSGQYIIHLNPHFYEEEYESSEISKICVGAIAHELTHLWQGSKYKLIQQYTKTSSRLEGAAWRTITSHKHMTSLFDVREVRILFHSFLSNIFIEGLAEYYKHAVAGKAPFEKATFELTYKAAWEMAELIIKAWDQFLLQKSREIKTKGQQKGLVSEIYEFLDNLLKTSAYVVGYHMVYTVLYVNHEMELEKVIKMKPFKFIKKYESCIKQKGYKPIVSLTSGEGLIDYNKLLKEWWDFLQKTKIWH